MSIFDYLLPARWVQALRLGGPSRIEATPAPVAMGIGVTTAAPLRRLSEADIPASYQPREAPIPKAASIFSRLARRADSIVNALSGLGGTNDKGGAGRPDMYRTPLAFEELAQLYRTNGYAQRFVDCIPADGTRKRWKVIDDEPDVDVMAPEEERLHLVEVVKEAATWGRLFGGGYVFIVADEDLSGLGPEVALNPRRALELPLDPRRLRGIKAVHALTPAECQPEVYDGSLRSPRFREPKSYRISPVAQTIEGGMSGQIVHWTRILYFSGKRLPSSIRFTNRGIDDSVIEAAWDAIRNKTSIDQAGAALAQEIKINILRVEDLAGKQTSDQAAYFEMRMKYIALSKSLHNMILLGKGEDFQSLATTFTGFDQLDNNAKEALCAVTGMPDTLLFGKAPSGISPDGEGPKALWANVISAWQQDRLRTPLTYLYHLLYRAKEGPTRGVEPESWVLEFMPLDELTEKAQADLELVHAQADQVRIDAGILPPEHIARSRYSEKGYSNELLTYDPSGEEAKMLAAANAAMTDVAAAVLDPNAPIAAPAVEPTATDSDEAQTDEAVSALAEKMTRHGIDRCEHGSVNRCRICGIERVRDVVEAADGTALRDETGKVVWKVQWRPIYAVVATGPAGA